MKQRKTFVRGVATATFALALGLAPLSGCGQQTTSGSDATTEPTDTTSETTAEPEESGQSSIANPWEVAQTAEETAQGAGLDKFGVPESVQAGGTEYDSPAYFYTKTIAQVRYSHDSDTILLRKSGSNTGKEGLAGDYNDYAETWSQDVDGIEVTCYGAAQEAAQLIMWQRDGSNYSLGFGFGGDTAAAMTPDDVARIVGSVQ